MKKNVRNSVLAGTRFLLLLGGLFALGACNDTNCIKGEGDIETRTLTLDPFTRVEANGDFNVYIQQGPVQTVLVKGEPNILDMLETDISNSTWGIEYSGCVRRSKQVDVYITLPEVQAMYLNGSGRITSQNTLTTTELPVTLNGSGKIELDVSATKVITQVTGSGKVVLQGETDLHNVNISGSGRAEAFNLQAGNVTVNLSGSGVAEVSASETLAADITGSGMVYYLGDPTVTSHVSGSGKVVKR
ncbi:head GIN domain-containing protein [Pontibacter sp. MBLB2868]|uniref:head GIN domain-containing protein n=1 Tax=Pontibacter sp. MBLB2868 TaxID=3451555 RepID=UPI003F74D867